MAVPSVAALKRFLAAAAEKYDDGWSSHELELTKEAAVQLEPLMTCCRKKAVLRNYVEMATLARCLLEGGKLDVKEQWPPSLQHVCHQGCQIKPFFEIFQDYFQPSIRSLRPACELQRYIAEALKVLDTHDVFKEVAELIRDLKAILQDGYMMLGVQISDAQSEKMPLT